MGKMFTQFTFTLVFQITLITAAVLNVQQEDPAVTRFREYLRINSAHPTPDYGSCIAWLRNQAREIGLDFHLERYEPEPEHSFAVWLTWKGLKPSLPSILMDSHMDVVVADPTKWDHPPFEAFKDAEGNIYARGAQDMKSTTIVTLEAIRRLKAEGFRPLRTVYVLILPDEELYSRGARGFVNSTTFRNMNIGFALDESATSENENMLIVYTEKVVWQYNITVYGTAMHGSLLPKVTAGQKLQTVINRLMEYRQTQVDMLHHPLDIQNVTGLNLVKIGGGLGNNIIPDQLWASFDMRIRIKPGWNLTNVEDMLNRIVAESGNDTKLTFLVKGAQSEETPVNDSNPWWVILQRTCREINATCIPFIPPGVTDGRHIRNAGVPLFGLNTIPNTIPRRYHEDNEFLNERSLLDGIDRMKIVVQNFASYLGSW